MAESLSITDFKNLKHLRTKVHQDRRLANSNLRTIHALDTETIDGNIFLIADSDGRYLDKITPELVIKWLHSKKYQGTWNFFYNLSYDAEVILKLLGEKLNSYKRTRKLSFTFENYKLEYIPAKKLSIKKGHHSAVFYDIAQFYHTSLVNAYQNNIKKLDKQYLQIKEKRKSFSKWFYRDNRKQVRDYCVRDCILTKELAQHWIKLFYDAFLFYPSRWISSGYLAEKVLINNEVDIPKFDSIPYEIQDLAYRSYFGGRFEILKRGFIGTAYLYDINSAYPHALTKIPDLTKGKWIKQKSIHSNAKLGFFKILANIPDCKYIPPFPFRKDQRILFPSGKFITYCTLDELKACESNYYKIIDSWQFVTRCNEYPFKEFIETLYKKRLELKQNNNPLQLPIKIILNSIYGKTGQKVNRKIGNLFNPVIFSFITGHTRAKLYRFVAENSLEKEIVSFATDSICCTKKLDVNSSELGSFSFENSADDVFYLQNGFYRFNGKWKQRGLGKLGAKEIEHLETFERDGELFYKFKLLRNTRLRTSILSDNVKDIGMIKTVEKQINLNADRKRLWFNKIESLNERLVNDSIPLCLNYFPRLRI